MQVTAVVVSHSRPDLLGKVVEALQTQTRRPDRILIMDNGSDSQAGRSYAQAPGIRVVRSEANIGGAGGFAVGMKSAAALGADWIWLLDDDAIPRSDALAQLLVRLPQLPATAAALCGTVNEYGEIALMHRRLFGWKTGMERCVPRARYRDDLVAVDIGSFVGFLVSACALDKVGLPNPEFFLAYDDTEFSLRLRKAGMDIWLVPSSIVDHMRCADARLRSSEFGRKHYFNIRNRIVVKKSYAHYSRLSGWSAVLVGIVMWVCCPGRFRRRSLALLRQAVGDGRAGRLGPFPAPPGADEADRQANRLLQEPAAGSKPGNH